MVRQSNVRASWENFSLPEHIIFWKKKCQWKIKILNFCLWYFGKLIWVSWHYFFSNFPCYPETYKTIYRFFQILDSKKEKHMSFFIIFRMPMKELKTFNLHVSCHFYKLKVPNWNKVRPWKSKTSKHMCFGPLLRQWNSSTITIDNGQTLVCWALDTQKCFDTWKDDCSETSRKEELTSKRAFSPLIPNRIRIIKMSHMWQNSILRPSEISD